MKTAPISLELLQATLNYLASKPYIETHQLIAELIKEAQVKPEEKKEEKKK